MIFKKGLGFLKPAPSVQRTNTPEEKNVFVLLVLACCKLVLLFHYISLVCNDVRFAEGLDVPAV